MKASNKKTTFFILAIIGLVAFFGFDNQQTNFSIDSDRPLAESPLKANRVNPLEKTRDYPVSEARQTNQQNNRNQQPLETEVNTSIFSDIELRQKSLLLSDINTIDFNTLSYGESVSLLSKISESIETYKSCETCIFSATDDGNFSSLLDVVLEVSQFQEQALEEIEEALKFAITDTRFHTHDKAMAQILMSNKDALNPNLSFLLDNKASLTMDARMEVYELAKQNTRALTDRLVAQKNESLFQDIVFGNTEVSTTLLSRFDEYTSNSDMILTIASALCSNTPKHSSKDLSKRYGYLQAAAFSNGTPINYANCE